MASPPPQPLAEVVEELVGLLDAVASGRSPDRAPAVRYTELRTALLASRLADRLPSFLLPCVSLYKFQDFVSLLAPDRARRVAFIERAFEGCREEAGRRRGFDVFD